MCGARPLWLSAGFILEEGFELAILERIVASMQEAAEVAGVSIVTGDTKVVERSKGDGLYVTTSGVGVIETPLTIAPTSMRAGDAVILSGDVGRHGMAIMATRAGLSFESEIKSDCAPLVDAVMGLLDAGLEVHCLRDLTRGGLATSLVELAEASGLAITIDGTKVPVIQPVVGAKRPMISNACAACDAGSTHTKRPSFATYKGSNPKISQATGRAAGGDRDGSGCRKPDNRAVF